MKELIIAAQKDNLDQVIAFVGEELEAAGCSMKSQMQIELAVEEIFVNIALYAYAPGTGSATVRVETEGGMAFISFIDRGVPFNPLAQASPDVTLSAEERAIGGLGIFMVRKSMDDVTYAYRDGQNILTLKKKL